MTTAHAAVVQCIDPRVQRPIREFLESQNLPEGTWAPLTTPGGSLNIETVLGSINLAVEHLGATQIMVFDHQDCWAYKQVSREIECEHAISLWDARELLEKKYPDVTVRTFLMVSQSGERWKIREIQG